MNEHRSPFSLDEAALDDPRVRAALRQYQERVEAGERPDRQAFLAEHADVADALAECLEGLEFVHGIMGAGQEVDAEEAPESVIAAEAVRPGQPLGDYQLLREVGRGGMGVVYEAVQLSLGRRVALKVLPFAAALDTRQLQRFRNEAQAAAQLHHPHIVPVHGLGTDRGVHYYAMQYIEGCTLADVIARLREEHRQDKRADRGAVYAQARDRLGKKETVANGTSIPTLVLHSSLASTGTEFFRAAARLAIQAADALEHAHQLGIIHRDIKPANLLLTADNHLWITDFGLARCRSEQDLTRSGDVVGTLRYMSPEQALAKHGLVDHRSDIYSLGTTLYELLALEPVYTGSDREEILRQIAWDEPRPLRRVRPAIPIALETIVLKAMAREPERRYATASDLGDDLRRFLDDRPILATRPTVADRAVKWARRHRSIVAALAAVLGVVMVGLVIALSAIWHEKEQTKAALADAQRQRERAEKNFRQALEGPDRLLWKLEDPRWAKLPGLPKLRQELSRQALRFLQEEFVRDDSTDPAIRFETGRVYVLLASIHCGQQEPQQAFETLQKALEQFTSLVANHPEEPAYRRSLGETYCLRGTLYVSTKQLQRGESDFRAAIAQYSTLLDGDEGGDMRNRVAWLLTECPAPSVRRPDQAVMLAQEAVAREPTVSRYWNTLGVAYYRAGRFPEALRALHEGMTYNHGGEPCDWFFLAMTHSRLGQRSQALQWFQKGAGWVASHSPEMDEWFRAGAEAAAMLGQKAPLPPDMKQAAPK